MLVVTAVLRHRFFAVSDAMKAHQAITEGGKVDFNNVSRSRLVLRLTEDETQLC